MRRFNLAIGGIPLPGRTQISLGQKHPSQTGVIALDITTEADVICEANIMPGYSHRSAEKLFEVRDYRALPMLADRHDWFSAFSGELLITLSIEQAMGIVTPPRATWLRTLLAECARIHSHLAFLSFCYQDSASKPLWLLVDQLRAHQLTWAGNRVHPMINQIGGLASDAPKGWLAALPKLIESVRAQADDLEQALARHPWEGLAAVTPQLCAGYGLSGPVARSCGLDLDRRATNLLAYPTLYQKAPLGTAGDAKSRFLQLINELRSSLTYVQDCLAGLPEGPVALKLSRRLKVPEGEYECEIEAPWGIAGALLVSRGAQTPWRLALRTPTFANVSALEALLPGHHLEQLPLVVASLGYAVGDLDK